LPRDSDHAQFGLSFTIVEDICSPRFDPEGGYVVMVELAVADGFADFLAGEHKRAVPWIAGPLVAHHGDSPQYRAFGFECLGDLAVCLLLEMGGDQHVAFRDASAMHVDSDGEASALSQPMKVTPPGIETP
jgi:hypothetical protein